jgi:ABC-type uncharacterized transport system permease subunit
MREGEGTFFAQFILDVGAIIVIVACGGVVAWEQQKRPCDVNASLFFRQYNEYKQVNIMSSSFASLLISVTR